ncbi:hypothetical protein F5Y07DRAFT_343328 [Xylaria sp. FL0933]|nr:hypothetical protein F5Y07DRAFT_343328 [Xylaria sp. FL0933]
MPQDPMDPIWYLDQSTLANDMEDSPTRDHYHPSYLQAGGVMMNAPSQPKNAGSTPMVWPTSQASEVPLPTQLSAGHIDMITGDTGNLQASMAQLCDTHDGASGYSRDYPLGGPMASGLSSSTVLLVKEPSFDPLSGRTQKGVLRNGLAGTRTPERSQIEPSRSPSSSESDIESRDKSRAKKTKVLKVFACFHDACPFTASSRKDVQRHLQSEKHRNDSIHMHQDKFYCEVPGCTYKLAEEGCSRRDNMLRHMSKVHGIELDREKRGRKRRREQ